MFAVALAAALQGDPGGGAHLVWRGEPRCGSQREFEASVRQQLPDALPPRLFAIAIQRTVDTEVEVELWISTHSGLTHRVVRDSNCAAVLEGAAYLVASAGAVVAKPAAPPPSVEPPRPSPPEPPAPADVPDSAWGARIGGGAGLGPAGSDLPAELTTVMQLRRVRLELGLRHRFSRSSGSEARQVAVRGTSGTAAVCAVVGGGPVSVLPCLGADVGALRGSAPQLDGGRARHVALAHGLARAAAAVRLGKRVRLWFAVEGYAALVRSRFVATDGSELFRAAPAGVHGLVGLELDLFQWNRSGRGQ